MATLDELLNNFGLAGEEEAEMEHVASDQSADEEEQALLNLLEEGEKTASEGGHEMSGSLADFYMQLAEQDTFDGEEKVAEELVEEAAEEQETSIEKLAEEYDAAGRIMARGFFDEFQKLARELEDSSDAKTPAFGERGTGYQMETNYEDKGKIVTQGGEQQHKNILKGQAEGPAGKAEGAMGPQFATAKHLVTSRAKQTNAS